MNRFHYTVKIIRRIYGKKRRAAYVHTAQEDFIRLKRWPAGGFADVILSVDTAIQGIDYNLRRDCTKKQYNNFLDVCTASLYCGPQGRVAAINSLTTMQVNELVVEGFVLSNILKTGSKYGYQPVIVTERSVRLLTFFRDNLRPNVNKETTARFFVTQEGSNFDVGRSLTRFFKSNMGLHLTTTTFRSMMETMADEFEQVIDSFSI